MKEIQLFTPTFRIEETLAEIRECLERGWTGIGFKTVEIEEAWKAYTGLPHAHFLNSATSGLHMALRLFKDRHGWHDGDEVITTPLTFVSTNHAIMYERLQPVFADVDQYLCLDPAAVAQAITPRTRAVMFVGLGGNAGQLDEIRKLCAARNLQLILDAAHMSGTWLNGKHAGYDCDAAVFSYQAVKNLPTADSGMICFRDAALDAAARQFSWLGINKDTYARSIDQRGSYKWYYDVESVGHKYHGNSVMAAMALVSLKYLEQDNAYRRQIAQWYDAAFAAEPGIERVLTAPGCESSRHLYQIMVDRRDELMLALNNAHVFPGVHYRDNTEYRMYGAGRVSFPRSKRASTRLVSLPNHLRLSREDVHRVAEQVCSSVRQMRSSEGISRAA